MASTQQLGLTRMDSVDGEDNLPAYVVIEPPQDACVRVWYRWGGRIHWLDLSA